MSRWKNITKFWCFLPHISTCKGRLLKKVLQVIFFNFKSLGWLMKLVVKNCQRMQNIYFYRIIVSENFVCDEGLRKNRIFISVLCVFSKCFFRWFFAISFAFLSVSKSSLHLRLFTIIKIQFSTSAIIFCSQASREEGKKVNIQF